MPPLEYSVKFSPNQRKAMENATESASYCQKVDGIARWLGTSVAAAFFASLERCSCVNVDADGEDEFEEAHDRPLMFTTFNSINSTASSSAAANHAGNANIAPPAVENLPV